MISWLRERLAAKDEAGFTLIELMMVVLIIAILIAIAIPTFLGARERAQDRAAQSDLRNGLTAAKVYYVDNENYGAVEADLEAIEPSIDFVAGDGSQTQVGFVIENVVAGDEQVVTFSRVSPSGTAFCISDTATGAGSGTYYNSNPAVASVNTAAECTGASW